MNSNLLFALGVLFVLCPVLQAQQPSTSGHGFLAGEPIGNGNDSVRTSSFFDGGDDQPLFKLPKFGLPKFGAAKSSPASKKMTSNNGGSSVIAASAIAPIAKGASTITKTVTSPLKGLGRTTSRFWANTIDFVNPFNQKKPPPRWQDFQKKKMPEKKPSIFGWLRSPESPAEIHDVNGFLRQPRPEQ